MPLSTPVVFLVFRRPELTKRVFETIREAKPETLLIVADGPQDSQEAVLCEQARKITEEVDWNCRILRNYSETNLGCRNRVASGISWAFEHVEEAIILEDDCLPHPTFFTYCNTLLDYYRQDDRVMVVSGNNFQDGQIRTPYSYYFSKYNHCWGWATWRRAWQHWRFSPDHWQDFYSQGLMSYVCDDAYEKQYWSRIFNRLFQEGQPNTWDYAWTFACWSQSGLTALPEINLVSNIGFGEGATHASNASFFANIPASHIDQLLHPPFVVRHREADLYTFNHVFLGNAMSREKVSDLPNESILKYIKSLKKAVKAFF